MRYQKEFFTFLLISIFLINTINADFIVGNKSNSIEKEYGPSGKIKGWINISLANESSDSLITDSLGNSISLISLLEKDVNLKYNCSIKDCKKDYQLRNGQKTKSFRLENGKSALLGFKFEEDIVGIDFINLTIESDAGPSCYNQLEMDFFDDGAIDVGNTKAANEICSTPLDKGCFDSAKETKNIILEKMPNPHCQQIKLHNAPGFRVGALVNNSKNLEMALYETTDMTSPLSVCQLQDSIGQERYLFCDIDYPVMQEKDYYVCIYSKEDNSISKIKGYQTLNGCGFKGLNPPQTKNAAFDIIAIGKQFGTIGTLEVGNSINSIYVGEGILAYIEDRYGDKKCSTKQCVIPIKVISRVGQNVVFKSLKMIYETEGIGKVEDYFNFYEIAETSSKIDSNFQKISLDQINFSLPQNFGKVNYTLKLNDQKIFSETIEIERVPEITGINIQKTVPIFPTNFEVRANTIGNITEYQWDFGDNETKITNTNKATHVYKNVGEYNLKVEIKDNIGRGSYKTFGIKVESPEKMVNSTLKQMKEDFNVLNEKINTFDEFSQRRLNEILEIDNISEELKTAETEQKQASSEEDYQNLAGILLALNFPKSVEITRESTSLPFYVQEGNINLDVLSKIDGEEYDSNKKSEYASAVQAWNLKNLDTKITYKEYSAIYDDDEKSILKIFELNIKEKEEIKESYYLIMKKLDGVGFKEDYSEKESGDYIYIDMKKGENNFVVSTTEDVDFMTIPIFLSPQISRLELSTGQEIGEIDNSKKWIYFGAVVFALFIFGLVIYLILQQWYKNKYEKYLFKDVNNLYNLAMYIESQRKKNISDKDIKEKLKKAGWNAEQIVYAMKKHAGKRTGMFELSLGKFFSGSRKESSGINKEISPSNSKFQGKRFIL